MLPNLSGNAIQYGPPGVAPDIRISSEKPEGEWQFTVRDNRLGFEQEYSDQIFGLFRRLHGRDHPGRGIGLGGRIGAESAPGQDSAFHFTLPAG